MQTAQHHRPGRTGGRNTLLTRHRSPDRIDRGSSPDTTRGIPHRLHHVDLARVERFAAQRLSGCQPLDVRVHNENPSHPIQQQRLQRQQANRSRSNYQHRVAAGRARAARRTHPARHRFRQSPHTQIERRRQRDHHPGRHTGIAGKSPRAVRPNQAPVWAQLVQPLHAVFALTAVHHRVDGHRLAH